MQDIKNNKEKTGVSKHILNTGHQYRKMEGIMIVLKNCVERPL
jgi:hypothetical protein